MDRLDYLRRDSFFTGVTEGNIGSARIIKMLDVHEDQLVVNSKGLYSIENYLISRRLMYWQVYLHKTTVSSEKVLIKALLRAKYLAMNGKHIYATPCLEYFLYIVVDAVTFINDPQAQIFYSTLDDNDIWSSLKVWTKSDDKILALLASDIVNRKLFHVETSDKPIEEDYIKDIRCKLAEKLNVDYEDTRFLVSTDTIQKDMYDINDDHINILFKDNTIKDISEASDLLNVELLSKKVKKYYLCHQRME